MISARAEFRRSVDGAWLGAAYTPEESRTTAQKEAVALSDTLIAELEAADDYVFGVPMHNFGIPSTTKLWIDQVVRVWGVHSAMVKHEEQRVIEPGVVRPPVAENGLRQPTQSLLE